MAVLTIVNALDPFLKKKSAPVENFNQEIKTLVENMYQTMYATGGIGLSAVQIGVLLRVIIVDVEHKINANGTILNKKQYTMINPVITSHSDEHGTYNEGCLSFPSQNVIVKRPKIVNVDYFDEHGQQQTITADGLFAICIQHEIDHLNGILITDHASKLKEELIMKRLKKMKDQGIIS